MAAFHLVEAINSPGAPGKMGDDRFGFDSAAGTAWVLDGATDATALKPFARAESGAAWFAGALSDALSAAPPGTREAGDYFQSVLAAVRARAEAESEIPLASLPPEAWPIASGIWMRRLSDVAQFAWLGDCMALDLATGELIGTLEASQKESEENRKILAQSEEAIWEAVRAQRRLAFETLRPIFSLRPQTAGRLNLRTLPVTPGGGMVLFSDGFFRLVDPYGLHDAASLAKAILTGGLSPLIEALRAFETTASRTQMARIKRADDACALWLRFE